MPGTGTNPCWMTLYPCCKVSEYCSLSGTDLLSDVPILLCSWPGSTRASMAVLSQIEPTPGAVIAAQAVPEDCDGGPSGEYFCSSASALVATGGWWTTVMSAPIRVSQNGDSDCLTETAEAPFGFALDDHDASPLSVAFGATLPLGAAMLSVDASTLSWLQSSLSMSISFMTSASLIARAGAASSSSAASAASSEGGVCALAASTAARLKPAASASSPCRLRNVVKIIAPPECQKRQHAFIPARNYGGAI